MRRRRIGLASWILAIAVLALVGHVPAWAEGEPFESWLQALRAEAASQGISEPTLEAALTGIEPIPRVIELDRKQPEFTLTFEQYMERVVPQKRVDKGQRMLSENRALLDEVARRYRVQPRFIVALWGIETDFGRITGGFPVVASLATLAHDGRRSKYFRGELLNALKIIDQGHIAADKMVGSWAGAMGQSQFMPSSFLNFAEDYDGDGRKDIWTTRADVFASAANYLSQSGWKDDQTWGRPVRLPAGFDEGLTGSKIRKGLTEWQSLGVRRADGSDLPTRNLPTSIILMQGSGSAAFAAYHNYEVILKWNRSNYFAVAVGTLSDRIKGR